MPKLSEFERYIKELCEALGHRDRHGGGLPITAEG